LNLSKNYTNLGNDVSFVNSKWKCRTAVPIYWFCRLPSSSTVRSYHNCLWCNKRFCAIMRMWAFKRI